jgi:hypothetical protein
MSAQIASIRAWKPNDRELILVLACGVALALYGCSLSYDRLGSAVQARAQATEKLWKVQSDTSALASSEQQKTLADQKGKLAALSMFDATPAISQLRMSEELVDLANRAGMRNMTVIADAPADGGTEQSTGKAAFSVIVTTIEADFDWSALIALIGQIEIYQTGYLLERLELRPDGKTRRMRASFRILHRNAGPLS